MSRRSKTLEWLTRAYNACMSGLVGTGAVAGIRLGELMYNHGDQSSMPAYLGIGTAVLTYALLEKTLVKSEREFWESFPNLAGRGKESHMDYFE